MLIILIDMDHMLKCIPKNHLVIYGRRDGLPMILCHDLSTQETHPVELPERFCVLQPGTNLVSSS